jgi:hypothetical protein
MGSQPALALPKPKVRSGEEDEERLEDDGRGTLELDDERLDEDGAEEELRKLEEEELEGEVEVLEEESSRTDGREETEEGRA